MTREALHQHSILVVGASRGLGRGIALALARRGAEVVAIARDREALSRLEAELGEANAHALRTAKGDATDPVFVRQALETYKPRSIVMVAGATPLMAPLREYSWEALSRPWEVDVKAAFLWLQGALRMPLAPGGRFVQISSGAALHGSPLSGGYAGAKQTQRFLVRYAADEARAEQLGIDFHTILPQLNPNTALGRAGIAAYAAKAGLDPAEFARKRFGERPLSPTIAGEALVELFSDAGLRTTREFVLSGGGLRALDPK